MNEARAEYTSSRVDEQLAVFVMQAANTDQLRAQVRTPFGFELGVFIAERDVACGAVHSRARFTYP